MEKSKTDFRSMGDETLLSLISDGDERAFEHLFSMYAAPLATLAKRMLRDDEAKEDVVQEVFLKIWMNRDLLGRVNQLNAWMRKLTINECLMYLRRMASYQDRLAILAREEQTNATDLADALHIKELNGAVERAIGSMPPQRKMIYELSRIEGLTAKEIAVRLGLSHGYVRNALSAALASIRQQLQPYIDISFFIFLFFFGH